MSSPSSTLEPDAVLLAAEDVKKYFPLRGGLIRKVTGHVRAVDGVSLKVRKGETLAVVGESGSGKTTLARVLLGLLEPTAGRVVFMGQDITSQSRRKRRRERRHLQMVFQDPMSSLDPRMTIKDIVGEPLVVHQPRTPRPKAVALLGGLVLAGGGLSILSGILSLLSGLNWLPGIGILDAGTSPLAILLSASGLLEVAGGLGLLQVRGWGWWLTFLGLALALASGAATGSAVLALAPALGVAYLLGVRRPFATITRQLTGRVLELLELVGLKKEHLNRFPHEFSGGQRQRINIARALALNPDVIILDEPTSALDVSVQAQILNLLRELQERLGLTYMFITHDLSVVYHIADRVAVMYAGRVVEIGDTEGVFIDPLHPYTRALISAAPVADPAAPSHRIVLEGEVPSSTNPPPGCRFHPRCWLAFEPCPRIEPPLFDMKGAGRQAACFATARDLGLWPSKTPGENASTGAAG